MVWIDETMQECFSKMNQRIYDSLQETDLKQINQILSQIKTPTLTTAVGGSSVVSCFAAKVLAKKNKIIAHDVLARDMKYMNLDGWDNVISCSYSGNNIGVDAAFNNNLNKYLFSGNKKDNTIALQYTVKDEECSYVSIAGTFIPLSILFLYYTDGNISLLKEILQSKPNIKMAKNTEQVEVIYGFENKTATTLLESSFIEGGLASVVLSEKYNYCHGRCMYNHLYPHDCIYFDGDSTLDEIMKKEFKSFYSSLTLIKNKYDDEVINDFYNAYQVLYLVKDLAEKQNKDISLKKVPDISETLYRFNKDF